MDGDALGFTVTLADGGALPDWIVFDSAILTGAPPADFNGALALRMTASDGEYAASDDFALTISPVNDAPGLAAALADRASPEDQAVDFVLPAGSFADIDSASLALGATLADGSELPGWLSFDSAARRFAGQPPADYNGAIEVRVTASDGELSVSDAFMLTITPANDAPVVATPIPSQSSPEDAPWIFQVPAGTFVDVDRDQLDYTASLANGDPLPAWLSFDAVTRTFSGAPPANYNGSQPLHVTASDGAQAASTTFTLNVTPLNDAPIAHDDAGFAAVANTPLTIAFSALLANDNDVDVGDVLAIVSVGNAQHGSVALTANGVVFTAGSGYSGPASFGYTVSDGVGGSANASVSLTVSSPVSVINGPAYGGGTIWGVAGPETINAYGYGNKIYANGGSGTINAGSGNATVYAGSGDLTINLAGYNDVVTGGDGDDIVSGSAGSATITLGDGTDVVTVGGYGNRVTLGDGDDTVDLGLGSSRLEIGNGSNKIIIRGYGNTIVAGDGSNALSGGAGNERLTFGNGDNDIKTSGYGNVIRVGDGDNAIVAGSGSDTVTAGDGDNTIILSGYSNTVSLGAGDNFVNGGFGGDRVTVGGGSAVIDLNGWSNIVTINGGATATINDHGGGLGVKIGSALDHVVINGMSADMNAWIDLLSPDMGYSSTSAIMSALQSDGNGGTLLPLAGGGAIDIAGVTPNHLSAANFRIG